MTVFKKNYSHKNIQMTKMNFQERKQPAKHEMEENNGDTKTWYGIYHLMQIKFGRYPWRSENIRNNNFCHKNHQVTMKTLQANFNKNSFSSVE